MKKLFFILSVIGLFGLSSCCSDDDENVVFDRGSLPNESINVFPYALNEIFYMKNKAGNSIKFTVTKKIKESQQDVYKPNVKGGCERTETTNYELLSSEITSDSTYLNIKFFSQNRVGVIVNSLTINQTGFELPVNINVKDPKENSYNFMPNFTDTLSNKTYTNVFELTTYVNSLQVDVPAKVYYNFEYGIIQIVTTKKKVYSYIQ